MAKKKEPETLETPVALNKRATLDEIRAQQEEEYRLQREEAINAAAVAVEESVS